MEKQTFIILLVLTCITAFQAIATLFVSNFGFAAICAAIAIALYRATDAAYKDWKEVRNG